MMLSRALLLIPPLTFASHKGQHGRVGVLGGSLQYTGAPYYAGISALKAGADLSFIFCTNHAAIPIKSYSPELIVYPLLQTSSPSTSADQDDAIVKSVIKELTEIMPRLHVLVVGPGLGRDPLVQATTLATMRQARIQGLPLVVDADGLYFVSQDLDSIRGNELAVLTPNVVEFKRLYAAVFPGESPALPTYQEPLQFYSNSTSSGATDEVVVALPLGSPSAVDVERLAIALGHVTILQKGRIDMISNGRTTVASVAPGAPRRCGGQGDILSGTTGLFAAYAVLHTNTASAVGQGECSNSACGPDLVAAAFSASYLTRTAAAMAFEKHKRATTTPDIINEIGAAFEKCFGE